MSLMRLVFHSDVTTSWKSNPKCSVCLNSIQMNLKEKGSRNRPYILSCYHDVCEKCLGRHNSPYFVQCKKCNKKTFITKFFQTTFNFFLNGEAFYKEFIMQYDVNRNSLLINNDDKKLATGIECGECNQKYTDSFCKQCDIPYCGDCFKSIHKNGKVLQKHNLVKNLKITMVSQMSKLHDKCKIHDKFYRKYCKKCEEVICVDCQTDSHSDHSVTTLKDENKKHLHKVEHLIQKVKQIEKMNKQALEQITNIERIINEFLKNDIELISSYYAQLHAILQINERNTLLKIKENTLKRFNTLDQVNHIFTNTTTELNDINNFIEQHMKSNANYFIPELIEKVMCTLESLPCQISFMNFEKRPFSIITENVEDYLNNSIKFVKQPDVVEGVTLKTFFGKCSPYINSKKIIIKTENIIENRIKFELSSGDSKKAKKIDKINEPNQIVYISSIISPHEFYVQNEAFYLQFSQFTKTLAKIAEIAETPDYIEINSIYLVVVNGKWYRGKVIKTSKKNENMFEVFLIDNGEVETVPKQYIRVFENELRMKEPGAYKCSIFGIKPIGGEWTTAAKAMMKDIVSEQNVILIPIGEKENTLLVDLITVKNFETSVRDALIFIDVADANDGKKNTELWTNYNRQKAALIQPIHNGFKKSMLIEGMIYRIRTLMINNPKEFYIMKHDSYDELQNMTDELNKKNNDDNVKIFKPRNNMACAVYLKNLWCRGKVLEVEKKGNCKVWLVDYGSSVVVTWKQLRFLDKSFLQYREHAIECSLADIEPLQSNSYTWTSKAIKNFKQSIKKEYLEIWVQQCHDLHYEVTLYIIEQKHVINVNALLVAHKHAKSTGPESVSVKRLKDKEHDENLNDSTSKLMKMEKSSEDKTEKNLLNENENMEKRIENSTTTQTKYSQKTKISMLKILTPGEFYINLSDPKNLEANNKLHKEIQDIQNKPKNKISKNKKKWSVNDKCLVFTELTGKKTGQWYRAEIIDIEIDSCTVFLLDHGELCKNINIAKLSKIDTQFKRISNIAIKCHLACVGPTSGSANWSNSSIDELKSLVEKYENLYAIIQGDRTNDSIPVILLGVYNKFTDALSPSVCKFININQMMVNYGFAHQYQKFLKSEQELKKLEDYYSEKQKEETLNALKKIDNVINEEIIDLDECKSNEIEYFDESSELENFTTWLPANPIEKTIFTAIPTFVDNDAIVYLQDSSAQKILNKIEKEINNKFKDYENIVYDDWYCGEPCIARYHLDNKYYRGEVIEIDKNDIKVCFIDYGNVEECQREDLIKDICFTKIPVQCKKYKVEGIEPNSTNNEWTRDMLDAFHQLIVMKICTIRVSKLFENDKIKECSIQCSDGNVADILINCGYAKKLSHTFENNNKPFEKVVIKDLIQEFLDDSDDDCMEHNESDNDDLLQNIENSFVNDTKNVLNTDNEYYKKLFEKDNVEKFYESIMSNNNISKDSDSESEPNLLSTNYHEPLNWNNYDGDKSIKALDDQASSDMSFEPQDTSTTISRFECLSRYLKPKLPCNGMSGFYCEIIFIRNALLFFVNPLLKENEQRHMDMTFKIQMYANKMESLNNFEPNTPCLAIYKNDGQWYRAAVMNYNSQSQKVNVMFVDFMNSEEISIRKVKNCPQQLLEYPLRLFEIKLANLKPNPRWKQPDIVRRLSLILDKKVVYAKIIRNDCIPEVKFLESENEDRSILQTLIDERLLLEKS